MKDKLGRYLFFVGIVLLLVIAVIWQLPKSKKDNVASSAVESEIEVTSETEDGNEADPDEKKIMKKQKKKTVMKRQLCLMAVKCRMRGVQRKRTQQKQLMKRNYIQQLSDR